MTDVTTQPAATLSSQLARTFTPDNQRLFLVAVALSVAPLWFGSMLPLVDIPQHAAQIAALHEMWEGNRTFTQLFDINWFTPYLLGYVLLYALALVVPIDVATQILVTLAVASIPLLTGRLLRVAGADERWKWLAIPASFSFCFYWGFLSFMVAFPFALLFLLNAIRFAHAPSLRNGAFMALFAVFLFFCHIVALAFTSVVALGYVLASSPRSLKSIFVRVLPFAAPLPLMLVWFVITYETEQVAREAPILYGPLLNRFIMLLMQPAGREAFSPAIGVLVSGTIALLPPLAGSTASRRAARWFPFILGLLLFFSIPAYALNTGFLYERLGLFLVPLWLLAWDPPTGATRRLEWLGMLVVVFWMFTTVARFAMFARETESFRVVTGAIEPGRRVAAMVFDSSSPLFATPVYMHFPAWYQATRRGIVDFNFADFFPQPVRYRADAGARINERLAWNPTEFDWSAHGGARYDYFLVKANFDISRAVFKEHRDSVQLVGRSGWWWLYRNLERQADLSSHRSPESR
jgi:hypothetical protein